MRNDKGIRIAMASERIIALFWSRVIKSDGCWLWSSTHYRSGYPRLNISGRVEVAGHRLSWALANGKSPADMFVCHRCDVRGCVNPDHLFIGTVLDNARDAVSKGRTIRGEQSKFSKLTDEIVREIRSLPLSVSHASLGRKYGISFQQISEIRHGRQWKHVK